VARPYEEVPADNVRPGLHQLGDFGVVWWDPLALRLDAPASGGIRKGDLFAKDVDRLLIDEDLERHRDWQAARASTIERGARPSLRVQTVSEYGTGIPPTIPVEIVELPRDPGRPAGARFGTLVHAVLATVRLDASEDAVRQVARQQGRILGAADREVEAAAIMVAGAFRHELLARARAAEASGRCRRETPITIVAPDGTLVEGVVDLAIEEPGGWTIVDFKTDRELDGSLDRYTRQVALYGAAVARATGAPAAAVLVRI
jgi:ATP-dependent exoDNAse (exonuclease V) beta subunit